VPVCIDGEGLLPRSKNYASISTPAVLRGALRTSQKSQKAEPFLAYASTTTTVSANIPYIDNDDAESELEPLYHGTHTSLEKIRSLNERNPIVSSFTRNSSNITNNSSSQIGHGGGKCKYGPPLLYLHSNLSDSFTFSRNSCPL
jgi:hypothetical protein